MLSWVSWAGAEPGVDDPGSEGGSTHGRGDCAAAGETVAAKVAARLMAPIQCRRVFIAVSRISKKNACRTGLGSMRRASRPLPRLKKRPLRVPRRRPAGAAPDGSAPVSLFGRSCFRWRGIVSRSPGSGNRAGPGHWNDGTGHEGRRRRPSVTGRSEQQRPLSRAGISRDRARGSLDDEKMDHWTGPRCRLARVADGNPWSFTPKGEGVLREGLPD